MACAICGGTIWNSYSQVIWEKCEDRGRDGKGLSILENGSWIGIRRAAPSTEVENPIDPQPVGVDPKIVFNGVISNSEQLGVKVGETDASVLPRVLDFKSLESFRNSLSKIVGSYAIAVLFQSMGEIWLAANYKPIWIYRCRETNNLFFSSLQHHLPNDGFGAFKFPPYSVASLTDELSHILDIPRSQPDRALVICSSGLDSTIVASEAIRRHSEIRLLYFDYGCLASKIEKRKIQEIAEFFNCSYDIFPLKFCFFKSSPLLGDPDKLAAKVIGAEYGYEWVPARNLILLSITVGYAESHAYGYIYLGTNLEEAGSYPDNEEQFIRDFDGLLYSAVQNGVKVSIKTPLGGLMKHEIVALGVKHKVPFDLTWSCYRGQEVHCGECGSCYMRKIAFKRNQLKDPAFKHEWSSDFWKDCNLF
ncbi:MAG: hypothetical protein GWN01_09375 [Nitrosopumilaceae archaeon]|nr:hypothetical protein [Nitrosopumilaceae archaeon]NIU87820.1 hypothetical protein [Nitrosopumilaceae archaeon]NIV65202.1 hypothetical protein [Nitrosopumilaceae archaeon]NIX61718.1 hypothetical protein [Nitrosopumilaceae archaeon]